MKNAQKIDPTKLSKVPSDLLKSVAGAWVTEAYSDAGQGLCVQVWANACPGCKDTPWEGTLRVAVTRTSGTNPLDAMKREFAVPLGWSDLQAIKDHLWPGRIALEIYPPKEKIVDAADMRWLWVLPLGAILPFNLQGDNPERLTS